MDFISEELLDYVTKNSHDEPDILKELTRETYQKVLLPRMLSGALQGRFLSMISKLTSPKRVLEIGPGTGALTQFLIPKSEYLTEVVEVDRESVQYLHQQKMGPEQSVHRRAPQPE